MMVRFSRLIMIALLWSVPLGAMAQQPATAPTQPLLKPAELDQLLAPIALHPDPLLSEVLIASTYPLEIVQADRLRACRGVWRLALSRLCPVLFSATPRVPRRRRARNRRRVRSRCRRSPCLLGQLRLGPRQHQRSG